MHRMARGYLGVLASLWLGISAAHASNSTEPILKLPASSMQPAKSKSFVVNEALGRAWVEVDFYHALSETSDHYRVAIPGLRYDKAQSQVIFESDDSRVVCANVVTSGRGIFKQKQVQPTGNCELSHRYVKKAVDNGFTVEQIEQFEVHFKPQKSDAT